MGAGGRGGAGRQEGAPCTEIRRPGEKSGAHQERWWEQKPVPYLTAFPGSSDGKEPTCNVGGLGSVPGWEDPLEKGKATHTSFLAWRILMDREVWQTTVHGVAKSQTQLDDFHFT